MSEQKHYYLDSNNQPVGPFELSKLVELANIGSITSETLTAKRDDELLAYLIPEIARAMIA